jgi:disulfide bond formation protein DsbB
MVELLSLVNTIFGIGTIIVLLDSITIVLLARYRPVWWQTVCKKYPLLFNGYLVLLAGISIIGPLVYQYVFGFPPCILCWYTRVCMWSGALLIITGFFYRELPVLRRYITLLYTIGIIISGYHALYLSGVTPDISAICVGGSVSCNTADVLVFNTITIPLMAVVSYLGQLVLLHYREPNTR